MSATLLCDIVTPERLIYSAEVNFVAVPASEGEIGFLAGRSPVMSTLNSGLVRVKPEENSAMLRFAVAGGYVEGDGRKIVVLANRATNVDEVELDYVKEKITETEQKLKALSEGDAQVAFFTAELNWYQLLENYAKR
ncbi:MAG: ATP synthase F1 subunit epsilon [Coriobacteriales bacterium]|jgi:F-type H+-transporting ATPase subunit epsilon|nr:ATP synthase F1 subunit epsilon [Coriobacteriales bacterium]